MADSRNHRGRFYFLRQVISKYKNIRTGEIINDANGKSVDEWRPVDLGLEFAANRIWDTIRDAEWRDQYQDGHFLFIFKSSLQFQTLESAFILSWSIWEHLFALHNKSWLSDEKIQKMGGQEKILFILNHYFISGRDEAHSEEYKKLVKVRNRVIHFGVFPTGTDKDQVYNFLDLTQRLVAMVIGLIPANKQSNLYKIYEEIDRKKNEMVQNDL